MTDPNTPEHPTPTPTLTVTSALDDVCAELRRVGPGVKIALAGRAAGWRYAIKLKEPPEITAKGAKIDARNVSIEITVCVEAVSRMVLGGYYVLFVPDEQQMARKVLGDAVIELWGEEGRGGSGRRGKSRVIADITLSLAVAPGLAELADIDGSIVQHQAARAMNVAAEEARYAAALAH